MQRSFDGTRTTNMNASFYRFSIVVNLLQETNFNKLHKFSSLIFYNFTFHLRDPCENVRRLPSKPA